MRRQNSYIFIHNPYREVRAPEEIENGIRIYLEKGFIVYLKSLFPTAIEALSKKPALNSKYTYIANINGNSIKFVFSINCINGNYYFDVIAIGKNEASIIKGLEYIQTKINESDIHKDYIEIISYDAISEYYCNKIYPKLNKLERNLRRLLFNVYIVNLGLDYYEETIHNGVQDKVKSVIQAKGKEKDKKIERLKKFFYSTEFTDIQDILFEPNWTRFETRLKDDFLETHKDLSKLTDDELRKAFYEFSPRSDWDRFFANKIKSENVKFLIEEVRKSRNSIAHCKFFYQNEYNACYKSIDKLNKAVKSAIAKTEKIDFSKKKIEGIGKKLMSFNKLFEELGDIIFQEMQFNLESLKTSVNNINFIDDDYKNDTDNKD